MVVDLYNLKVAFDMQGDSLTILDIPCWRMDKGKQIAIFGPSGCGKSTLLHAIAGLLAPSTGSIVVCGTNLANLSEARRDAFRARHIGYIFQNFNLLQGYSALENVLMGMTFSSLKPDNALASRLLDEMGLSKRMRHLPSEMSIGEQQRVSIARALAKRPDLILADEPTGSLDPVRTGEVVAILRDSCRRHACSLLVVSHEESVVGAFDERVSFLELNQAFTRKEAVA